MKNFKRSQRGMTFISLVIGGGILVFVSIIVMKMVPSYIEYFSVKKVLEAMKQDAQLPSMSPMEIRYSFEKRASIDNVKAVSGSDLTITKGAGRPVIEADWEARVPLMGNVSAVMEFHATTEGAGS